MRIGQRVVCIDVNSRVAGAGSPGRYLRIGEQHTIRSVRFCACGMPLVDVGISPEGGSIACPCGNHWEDSRYWFCADRFALIEEKSEMTFDDIVLQFVTILPMTLNKCQKIGIVPACVRETVTGRSGNDKGPDLSGPSPLYWMER